MSKPTDEQQIRRGENGIKRSLDVIQNEIDRVNNWLNVLVDIDDSSPIVPSVSEALGAMEEKFREYRDVVKEIMEQRQ